MRKYLLIPLVLVGCSTSKPPEYVNANPPPVQRVLDSKVQQMSRNEVIQANHECESSGMRSVPIMSKRLISGMMSDIIVDVQCMPKLKFIY